MTIFKICLTSTTDGSVMHEIVVDTEKGSVTCSCKSGRIRGWCKHIRFYKDLIRDLMRKSPGRNVEKGGK